jgi:hypothetical protein
MEAIQNQTLGDLSPSRAISARQAVLKQSKRERKTSAVRPNTKVSTAAAFTAEVRLTLTQLSADVSDR